MRLCAFSGVNKTQNCMKNLFLAICILLLFACDETEPPECSGFASCLPTEEMMQADLDSLKEDILTLVKSGSCMENGACTFIGLGSKPCGGPWEYLIFSTSVDTATLFTLVNHYNSTEEKLNEAYGRGSDCAIAPAPDSVICESSGCIAYRNEVAFKDGLCCD